MSTFQFYYTFSYSSLQLSHINSPHYSTPNSFIIIFLIILHKHISYSQLYNQTYHISSASKHQPYNIYTVFFPLQTLIRVCMRIAVLCCVIIHKIIHHFIYIFYHKLKIHLCLKLETCDYSQIYKRCCLILKLYSDSVNALIMCTNLFILLFLKQIFV